MIPSRSLFALFALSLLFFKIAHIRHDSPSQIILAHIQAWVTPVITTTHTTVHLSRECPLTLCPSTQKVVVTHSTTRFLLSDLFLWRFLQKIANAYKLLWWIRTLIPGCILWRHDSRFLASGGRWFLLSLFLAFKWEDCGGSSLSDTHSGLRKTTTRPLKICLSISKMLSKS